MMEGAGAETTVIVKAWLAVAPIASVTLIVKDAVPVALGVPEIMPLDADSPTPVGSEPDRIENV